NDFGLFLADEDIKKGLWLEAGRALDYYLLRNGDLLEYKTKVRILKVRTLDGAIRKIQVDDSHTVGQLLISITSKIVNWLDHAKTLREQGINSDDDTILLRRKFFFSDQNVDARDPVQLSLLFVQTRDAILNGTHPVSQDEAIQFAGIQCQIQFGDHDEKKHKPGLFEERCKSEVYTVMPCAEDVWYHLLPCEESVVRVDEKTKEIMKHWPLTTVRRWAASPNSFTLDFGDHADQYYSVQTQEGEQIAALIAGYIDIILRKKKNKDHLGIEGDDDALMFEENVSSAKATIISHQSHNVSHGQSGSVSIPGVMRDGGGGESQISTGSLQQAMFSMQSNQAHAGQAIRQSQSFQEHNLTQAQRALVLTIDDGLSAVSQAQSELDKKIDIPDLGSDYASRKWRENNLDLSRQKVSAQLSAMNAATAQLVTLTGTDEPDYGHVGASVNQIGNRLMDAARRLAGGLSDLLNAVQPERQEPRQNVLQAASRVGEASHDVMDGVGESIDDMDKAYQETLIALAKAVANATAQLVLKAKSVASTAEDQELQNRVISSATQCALATSQLVVAPTIGSQACQEQIIESAKMVAQSVEGVVDQAASVTQDERLLQDLGGAATAVTQALNDMLKHIKLGAGPAKASESQEEAVDTILTVTDRLFSSVGDAHDMVKQARQLAQATSMLVNTIRGQAEDHPDADVQKRLLAAAKALADATAKMVEAAKAVNDELPALVQGFRGVANNRDSARAQLTLLKSSQEFVQPANSLVSAANAAGPTVSDQAAATNLHYNIKNMSAALAELRSAASKAQEAMGFMELESALEEVIELDRELVEMKQSAQQGDLRPLPGETSEVCASNLGANSKKVGSAMAQLLTAAAQGNDNYVGIAARDTANALRVFVNAARGVAATSSDSQEQQLILESAREVIAQSNMLLEAARNAINNPNNPDNQQRLQQVAKSVSSSLDTCVNCLPGQRDVDLAIRHITETSQSLSSQKNDMTDAAVGLNTAASEIITHSQTTSQQLSKSSEHYSRQYQQASSVSYVLHIHTGLAKDPDTQNQIVGGLKSVSMVSSKLLLAAKSVSIDPNAPNAKNLLAQAARAVTESINQLINICTMMKSWLDNPNEPVSDMPYFECLDTVIEKSKTMGGAMTGMTNHAMKGETDEFCTSVQSFSSSVCGVTEASVQAAYLVGIADPASEPGRPGLVDQSQFSRANQAIQMACQNLTNPASSQQQVLSAATVVAKHTSALCNACRLASSKTDNPVAKRHFVQSAKDVANSTANLVKAIKALDSNFTEENRQKCAEAAKPLVDAVDELTTFASSPEFASKQAKISPKLYSTHSKSVSDSIKRLVSAIRDSAPGQKECDEAIEKVNRSINDLDQASLAAISQNLAPRNERSLRSYQEQMISCSREILEIIESVKKAASSEPENLGHMVTKMANFLDPLSDAAVGAASLMTNSKQQMSTLDLTKTVIESTLQFLYSSKEGGGNPKASTTQENITTAGDDMRDVVQDLLHMLEDSVSQAGEVTTMIDKISKSISRTDERIEIKPGLGYVDYQTNMVKLAKNIAKTAQDMIGKAGADVESLGVLANQLTRDFDLLASDSRGAATTVANRIRVTVQDLGKDCIMLVSFILATLQSGSRGTQACINAAHTVSGIIADLDTTIMFATAGTLNAEGDESFADHRENILKTAKALVEDTKTLVAGAASNQEQLANAAQMAVKTITRLADVVKFGAGSLGSDQQEAQVLLINAVKDVASALSDLISATKNASGKSVQDPAMLHLKESAKVMVTNVTSLLKTVKSVEDEATRGTRALESTIEAIGQEIKAYEANPTTDKKASAEDLIRYTKPLSQATAKAVAAGNSGRQEDVIVVANMGRKAVFDLLGVCKAAAATAETHDVRARTIHAGGTCAGAYKNLLEQVNVVLQKPSVEARQQLTILSRSVATSVSEIVHAAEAIKGMEDRTDNFFCIALFTW
ncbi:TLN1-like protein, partial [Mya arenaria]